MNPAIVLTVDGVLRAPRAAESAGKSRLIAALPGFIARYGHEASLRPWLDAAAIDAGSICMDSVLAEVLQGWIAQGREHPALDALIPMLRTHLEDTGQCGPRAYPEVPAVLRGWRAAGHTLHLCGHDPDGTSEPRIPWLDRDRTASLISTLFDLDATARGKPESYRSIALRLRLEPRDLLFISARPGELDAASEAGLQTIWLVRDATAALGTSPRYSYTRVATLDQIRLESSPS